MERAWPPKVTPPAGFVNWVVCATARYVFDIDVRRSWHALCALRRLGARTLSAAPHDTQQQDLT